MKAIVIFSVDGNESIESLSNELQSQFDEERNSFKQQIKDLKEDTERLEQLAKDLQEQVDELEQREPEVVIERVTVPSAGVVTEGVEMPPSDEVDGKAVTENTGVCHLQSFIVPISVRS